MKRINLNSISILSIRLLLQLAIITLTTSRFTNENISLTTIEIIEKNGYSAEKHHVITEDDYILELHRIPINKNGDKPTKNYPVFIHHGLLGSSADWVVGDAKMSLPMQLADEGYDVWLGNCRGNIYSRKHKNLDVYTNKFWDFSFHELGKYDLPASIDYIINNTNAKQIHYIGYSMGTTIFYIMGSERPEYQLLIRSQISLAPIAFLYNTKSILKPVADFSAYINFILELTNHGAFMLESKMQFFIADTICKAEITKKMICIELVISSICGDDPYGFDDEIMPIIMGHFPVGTSSKLINHFAQLILKDSFSQYDYGFFRNNEVYHSSKPPQYNLNSINVPITLIYGNNDLLAEVTGVMKLKSKLPKVMDIQMCSDKYFNHVDFLWSKNVNEEINNPCKVILSKTDDENWEYLGPNPNMINVYEMNDYKKTMIPLEQLLGPINNHTFIPALDYLTNNLDTIIENTMPKFMDQKDVKIFEHDYNTQKIIFSRLIEYIKSEYIMANNISKPKPFGFVDKTKNKKFINYHGLKKNGKYQTNALDTNDGKTNHAFGYLKSIFL